MQHRANYFAAVILKLNYKASPDARAATSAFPGFPSVNRD